MPVKKLTFTLFISLFLTFCYSQNLIFDWKHEIHNGQRSNEGRSICTDTAGYVYVGGRLEDTIQFIDTILNCVEDNAFLAKISPDGELVWVKWYRYSSLITAMCFDHENNLCVTGNYYLYLDLGDTILHTNHADTGYCSNQFIAKYDTDGNLLWAKSNTGVYISGYSTPIHNITIDNENNILITGRCIEELQYFDTSITINVLDSFFYYGWYYYYKSVGFLAKYSSSGDFLWVKELGGSSCEPAAIKTDNSNNILITGQFNNTAYFDTIMIEPYGSDIFLVKYSSNGDLQWVETAGGSAGNEGYDIAVDSLNNVYLTGSVDGNDVQFGGNILYDFVSTDAYLSKYDSIGNFLWVEIFGKDFQTYSSNNLGASLCIKNNEIYMLGSFMDSMTYAGQTLESGQRNGLFLFKMDLDANVTNAGQYLEDPYWNFVQQLTVDNEGNIYIVNDIQISTSNYKIMIAKVTADFPVNITEIITERNNILVYPNPTNGIFTITTENNAIKEIFIYDLTGKIVYSDVMKNTNKQLDVSFLQKGCYLLKLIDEQEMNIKKIIIKK